jgi:hypothetical protein
MKIQNCLVSKYGVTCFNEFNIKNKINFDYVLNGVTFS